MFGGSSSLRRPTGRDEPETLAPLPVSPARVSGVFAASARAAFASPSGMGDLAGKTPLHQGYLNKEGKGMMGKRWQQRYFALYETKLCYWVDISEFKAQKKPKGQIDLRGCSLATGEQHTKRMNTFGLFHTHRRDYFLEARNKESLMVWVTNIEGILGVKEEGVGMSDFELMTVVGKGGYGKVVMVKKLDTGKIYAMKILSKESMVSKNKVQEKKESDFEKEMRSREHDSSSTISGLINVDKALYKHWLVQSTKAERRVLEVVNHPFIVKLHFAFQTKENLCLVLDFINGGELFSHLSSQRVFSEVGRRNPEAFCKCLPSICCSIKILLPEDT